MKFIYYFLLNIYHYNFLFFYLFLLFLNINYNLFNKTNIIKLIYNKINKCGVVALKFTQWISYRINLTSDDGDNSVVDLFDNIYENCKYHDINYTKQIFYNNFNENLFDVFDEHYCKLVASGSIGQVYKTRFVNSKDDIALKIMHPNIYSQILYPKLIIKIINFICLKVFEKLYIPCDFDSFFISLENQLDFDKEYTNSKYIYECYKDNKYVIIPKPYFSSKNVYVSSFEDGVNYNDIDVSSYIKSKFVLLFILFLRQSILIDGLIHADLHKGNWKIRYTNKDDYKLIIYDMGYCFKENINITRQFISSWERGDSEDLCKSFVNTLLNIRKEDKERLVILLKNDIIGTLLEKPMNMTIIIPKVTSFFISKNLLLSGNSVNLFVTLILVESVVKQYGFVTEENKNITMLQTSEMHYKLNHINLITYCDTYKCFTKLSTYLKESLKKNKLFKELFPNLEILLDINDTNYKFLNIDEDIKKSKLSYTIDI